EITGSSDEGREHADFKSRNDAGKFGKLSRIGYLGGDVWKTTVTQKMCRLVRPHSRYTQKGTLFIESHTMFQVQDHEETN
ncbi:4955_t:CDS:2, partial [Funneliformis geosporum]